MANAEHLEILRSGVERWNEWRERNKDIEPDLSYAHLSHADLPNVNLSNAKLYRAFLTSANLSQADLTDANLVEANLRGADLHSASLKRVNLMDAIISHANLNGSDLSGANLDETDMNAANLTNSNLKGAKLIRTNLFWAHLDGADLHMAEMGFTIFSFTDLSLCRGLETAIVHKACTIDFYTLRKSKNIPKSFLLKIGLSELYIDYLPDLYQDQGIQLYPVFLSHSWENKKFARKLYEALIAKGVNVFFDEKKLKMGDEIFEGISKGIDYYDKMILICSEKSLSESWWVDRELDRLLKKEMELFKETKQHIHLLIPITIDDHVFQWNGAKAQEVRRYVIGDFRDWKDDTAFEKALYELIHALNVDRPEIKPPSYIKKK